MTKGLGLFFAFYFLVGQPAILGWMQNDNNFYWLAGLNAGVFFVARLVSSMSQSSSKELGTEVMIPQILGEKSENNSGQGISLVKVQESTEKDVEVAKVGIKQEVPQTQQVLSEGDSQSKLQEDKGENSSEKTMKEGVSIPKIVQSVGTSGRMTTKKKRKSEFNYGQRVVLLLTLVVAGVIAYTLWEFLENWGIAIALFLGRILYLIIGKLFDVNGFYSVRKLFTNWLYILLILGGIGYGIYSTQQQGLSSFLPQSLAEKISSYTDKIFGSDDSDLEGTGAIYVFEGTGEVITDSENEFRVGDDSGTLDSEVLNDNIVTGVVENPEPEVNVQQDVAGLETNVQPKIKVEPEVNVENQTPTPATDNPEREITMGEAVKHLLQGYTLSTKNDKSFTYVAKSNELYPYFKTAQEKAMVGFDTNPNKRISCETYMSLMGILEGWSVNIYDRSQTRNIYWNKANELGKTNGCAKGSFVKVKNL